MCIKIYLFGLVCTYCTYAYVVTPFERRVELELGCAYQYDWDWSIAVSDPSVGVGDFDVSFDGGDSYFNTTMPHVSSSDPSSVVFACASNGSVSRKLQVALACSRAQQDWISSGHALFVFVCSNCATHTVFVRPALTLQKPTHVRYTANQGFPQCAVYNQEGFPAFPFTIEVEANE